ncbi:putative leucine-rich repeat-containing protein, partial [Crotalus adamanteus]
CDMQLKQPIWTCCCWLGICLWLLAGERKLCRIVPCGRNTNGGLPSSRQQCHGAQCFSRSNRSSYTFVQSTITGQDQSPSMQQPQQSSIGSILGILAVTSRGTQAICSGGRDCISRILNSTTQDCKGIDCWLPLHICQKPRPASQIFPCPPNQGEGCLESTMVRATEKAAQFIGEELAYTASELGGAALGVQLICDVKPVPSEDALVLQLQLRKGQEKFVETLKSQQVVIVDLQQKLAEQQNALVIQQLEIIMLQRKMYEQMDLIKVQYDRICQDRNECIESPSICGERIKCLNTQIQFVLTASETILSETWAVDIALPLAKSASSQIYPGFNLKLKEKQGCDMGNLEKDSLVFKDHGLMWADFNFAVKHNCRNFLHLSLKFKDNEEEYELSGARIEQPEGKVFQSASVSGAAEVEPSQTLSIFLKSPNQFCNQSKDVDIYNLQSPFSLFWLSHDTGAVAMTAQITTSVHYETNYQPTFKFVSISDSYMLTLSHDGRAIKFTEMGVVKFVFQQALYSMGHTCIHEGFNMVVYLNKNGTNAELMTVYKSGVNYRDTSVSVSGATKVSAGDLMSFEILSPAQCSIRYFGDNSGISTLSLIWLPSAVSTALSARVSVVRLPTGAVRNKVLDFAQVSTNEKQIYLISTGQFAQKYFLFTERGIASVVFILKLIHSCNMLPVTLNQCICDNAPLDIIAQQIGGQVPEGSIWTSVSLRSSFKVHNGTMVFVSLDCVRGRINHIAHEYGTSLSILWISS